MTLKEFFRKARRGRKWSVKHQTFIFGGSAYVVRCANDDCPLAAVSHGDWNVEDAARRLGLRERDAEKIAGAADSELSPHRPWLLKNLGIAP